MNHGGLPQPCHHKPKQLAEAVNALQLLRVAINQRGERIVVTSDNRSNRVSEQGHDSSMTSSGRSELVERAESYCVISNVGSREISTGTQQAGD